MNAKLKSFLVTIAVLHIIVFILLAVNWLYRHANWVFPVFLIVGIFCLAWAAVHDIMES